MSRLSLESLALTWGFFFLTSSTTTFEEYSPLYMKQIGLNANEVGLTSLIGIFAPSLLVPPIGFIADKFRARKLVLFTAILVTVPLILLPVFPLLFNLQSCLTSNNGTSGRHRPNDFDGNSTHQQRRPSPNGRHINRGMRIKVNFSKLTKLVGATRLEVNSTHACEDENGSIKNSSKNVNVNEGGNEVSVALVIYMITARGLYDVAKRVMVMLLTVSTLSFTRREGGSFGSYRCWGDIASSVSLFSFGMLTFHIFIKICEKFRHGYVMVFPWSASWLGLSLLSIPWIIFEYLHYRVVDWAEVKGILSDGHYVVMLLIACFCGGCFSFQVRWENWYVRELGGSPVVMGTGGLLRRAFIAVSLSISGKVMNAFGELKTVSFALFLYAVAFLSFSLIQTPWLILVVDVFQSAAFAISYSSLAVHFSKAGSKASSAIIQGKEGIFGV